MTITRKNTLACLEILIQFDVKSLKKKCIFNLLSCCAVRELGQFHGACYALKETNHGLFDIIIKAFRESRFASECDEIYDAVLKVTPKRGTQAVRENPDLKRQIPEEFLHKIDELSNDPWPYLQAQVQPREPLAIICHGDFLRNNIAFKYDENVSVGVKTFNYIVLWPRQM